MSRMVFFNVGWMNGYQGADRISGGGGWVDEHGVGHEMFNFATYKGYNYGYVRTSKGHGIKLERLGGRTHDDYVDDITVVWVATSPTQGRVRVVGWYDTARVYRTYQHAPAGASRKVLGEQAVFVARACADQCRLLDVDYRTLSIPRRVRGGMGQSNVWYADSDLGRETIKRVRELIQRGGKRLPRLRTKSAIARSPDPVHRARVEAAAIQAVCAYYRSLGFEIQDVQSDNVGWDLVATRDDEELLLEVKGLSGSSARAELTPKEYEEMRRNYQRYRLCIVTNALDSPRLRRFMSTGDPDHWRDQDDEPLSIQPIIGARVTSP